MYLEGDKFCRKKKIEQDKVDQVCQGRGLQFSSQKMSWIWHRLSKVLRKVKLAMEMFVGKIVPGKYYSG